VATREVETYEGTSHRSGHCGLDGCERHSKGSNHNEGPTVDELVAVFRDDDAVDLE
jgi:hypothetical protein